MTLPERCLPAEVADAWLRACMEMDHRGGEIRVSGSCMEPSLPEGSRVRLRWPDPPPRVGDIVLLKTPSGLRLHRVLIRLGSRIRTKGDRGVYLDPAGSARDVIAVCDAAESRGRRLLRTLHSLARLLTRSPEKRAGRVGGGDGAHARLLP